MLCCLLQGSAVSDMAAPAAAVPDGEDADPDLDIHPDPDVYLCRLCLYLMILLRHLRILMYPGVEFSA